MTQRLYHTDTYLREFTARAVAARPRSDHVAVALDRTAFYVN